MARSLRRQYQAIRAAIVVGSVAAFVAVFGATKQQTEAQIEPATPTPVATARPVFVPPNPADSPIPTAIRPHARTRAS